MWQVDTTKHYKMWFSDDPKCFLGIENECRFIRTIVKNPQAHFTFVYSSSCLEAEALLRLKSFCQKHRVTALDFDTEVKALLTAPQDLLVYERATLEIKNACAHHGGNLAAASDCARTLVPLIEKCGTYSDFDLQFDFSDKPKFVKVKAPLVLPTEILCDKIFQGVTLNNEFLMASINPEDRTKLSFEAIEGLRATQAEILTRYAHPEKSFFKAPIKGLPEEGVFAHNPSVANIIKHYFKKNPDANIFMIRKYLLTFDIRNYFESLSPEVRIEFLDKDSLQGISDLTLKRAYFNAMAGLPLSVSVAPDHQIAETVDEKLKAIRHQLLCLSVKEFTGPSTYFALIQDKVPEAGFRVVNGKVVPQEAWRLVLSQVETYGLNENNLEKCVTSKNATAALEKSLESYHGFNETVGSLGDQAWLPLGAIKKQLREQEMAESALVFQHVWARKKAKRH